MANTYADRVQETSTTTGTGAYDLDGPTTGYQGFVAGAGDTNTVTYLATDGTDWEVGTGVVTDAATDTLSRASILSSSNAGAAVNWGVGTKTISLTLPASIFDQVEKYPKYAIVSHTESAGTDGGDFSSGAWRTRPINTEDYDPDGLVSLSSNQITFAEAGKYRIEAWAICFNVVNNSLQFYNITDSATGIIGDTNYARSGTSGDSCKATLDGIIDIAASDVFELQHQCDTTQAGNGFGEGSGNTWQICKFAQVCITKIA